MKELLMTTNDVAKYLGKARETVLWYERAGKLSPMRTQGGVRLFRRADVERLRAEKAQRPDDASQALSA